MKVELDSLANLPVPTRPRLEVSCGSIFLMRPVEAHYEAGLLRPTKPLALRPGEGVGVIVVRLPDPSRWNLDRLSKTFRGEDESLAEAGLAHWADALDAEDSS